MMLLDLGHSDYDARHGGPPARQQPAGALQPASRPQADRDPPAETLAKVAVSAAIATKDAVDAELFNVVRIGLMLSSGRPGVKKLMFVFTDRIDPKRKSECFLATTVSGGDLLLVADCLGRTADVARVAIGDPAAADGVRAAVQKFLLETSDRFARGAK